MSADQEVWKFALNEANNIIWKTSYHSSWAWALPQKNINDLEVEKYDSEWNIRIITEI